MSTLFNKDFYQWLPKYLQTQLDERIELYSDESWFLEAWEAYREHINNVDKKHMKSPNLFFSDYDFPNQQIKKVSTPESNDLDSTIVKEYCDNDVIATEEFLDNFLESKKSEEVEDEVILEDIIEED